MELIYTFCKTVFCFTTAVNQIHSSIISNAKSHFSLMEEVLFNTEKNPLRLRTLALNLSVLRKKTIELATDHYWPSYHC